MSRKTYDPLAYIPSPDVLGRQLEETEQLASRLRILLRVSEEVTESQRPATAGRVVEEAGHVT